MNTEYCISTDLSCLSDEELMHQFQQGSQRAFLLLMRRYKGPVITFTYRYIGNYDKALNIAQDIFSHVHSCAGKYLQTMSLRTWLFTIMVNQLRPGRHGKAPTFVDSPSPYFFCSEDWDIPATEDTSIDRTSMSQRVQKALMTVPPECREVVIMHEILHIPSKEICQITGCDIGMLTTRINVAKKQMLKELVDLYEVSTNEAVPQKQSQQILTVE